MIACYKILSKWGFLKTIHMKDTRMHARQPTHKLCLVILHYSYNHTIVYLFPADKSQELADLKIKLDE